MNTTLPASAPATGPSLGVDIADWRPEDDAFWESTGKRIFGRLT